VRRGDELARGSRLGASELFDESVSRLGHARCTFESLEPCVDATPTGADEVNEQRKVVHAGVPLGEDVALEAFEPTNGLVEQSADLGDVARDRQHLRA
jgi:hypothetical protein